MFKSNVHTVNFLTSPLKDHLLLDFCMGAFLKGVVYSRGHENFLGSWSYSTLNFSNN